MKIFSCQCLSFFGHCTHMNLKLSFLNKTLLLNSSVLLKRILLDLVDHLSQCYVRIRLCCKRFVHWISSILFNMFPSLPAHANFFIFNRQASAMLALCRLKVIEEENWGKWYFYHLITLFNHVDVHTMKAHLTILGSYNFLAVSFCLIMCIDQEFDFYYSTLQELIWILYLTSHLLR